MSPDLTVCSFALLFSPPLVGVVAEMAAEFFGEDDLKGNPE